MIKLLALDLDGTVLNSTGQIVEKNREAIRAAEEADLTRAAGHMVTPVCVEAEVGTQ